jgi:hypothetical protein
MFLSFRFGRSLYVAPQELCSDSRNRIQTQVSYRHQNAKLYGPAWIVGKIEIRSWKMETGRRKLENGKSKLAVCHSEVPVIGAEESR